MRNPAGLLANAGFLISEASYGHTRRSERNPEEAVRLESTMPAFCRFAAMINPNGVSLSCRNELMPPGKPKSIEENRWTTYVFSNRCRVQDTSKNRLGRSEKS